MRHIIQELMEPRTFTDGHIRTPTPIMLKAGKAMMNLLTIAEQDRAGRIKAEQLGTALANEINQLRGVSLEAALEAYREAVNKEYVRDFT